MIPSSPRVIAAAPVLGDEAKLPLPQGVLCQITVTASRQPDSKVGVSMAVKTVGQVPDLALAKKVLQAALYAIDHARIAPSSPTGLVLPNGSPSGGLTLPT